MRLYLVLLNLFFSINALAQVQWPLKTFYVTQEFADRYFEKYYPSMGAHWGIDISERANAEVYPIDEGNVSAIGTDDCPNEPNFNCNFGYGNWVLIDHPKLGFQSFYGHLRDKSSLQVNAPVSKDLVIGHEGRSGHVFEIATGKLAGKNAATHLHLSLGRFKVYKTNLNKVDIQVLELYDPRGRLPSLPVR